MSRWPSKRLLKRLVRKIEPPYEFKFDAENASCVEGGLWHTPHGIWPPDYIEPWTNNKLDG